MIGLSVGDVNKWAKDAQLENADVVNPGLANEMVKNGVDFMIDPNIPNRILYEGDSFWQGRFNDIVGTLVHEYAHLQHPSRFDTDFQLALFGPTGVNEDDTTNISKRITKDCFKNVKNP